MISNTLPRLLLALATLPALALAQSGISINLPERTRLLEDQRVDLVIEVRNVSAPGALRVTANGVDLSSRFSAAQQADLDCDGSTDWVLRADLQSFPKAGDVRIIAELSTASGTLTAIKDLTVYKFSIDGKRRNAILFIGDAMGTAYRDAARLVGRSVETVPGVPGLREGFFDRLLEMDQMPISGMVMTYASDRVIPDSANTASAWSMGNKTFEGALGVFADGTDCRWRAGLNQATLASALDNPKVETIWEYLKRKYNYKTGIVSTAYITDATPAGEGSHTAQRGTRFEVARQYLENPILGGPVFDVILGGGKEDFDADIRADGRDLVAEFQGKGYRFVSSASGLAGVSASDTKVLGLFRRPNKVARSSNGVNATANGNMDVAYDKLGLQRPASEPQPEFGSWTDQPFLDVMTQKAIDVLGGPDGSQPFILMVEGASVDKQSHPNHAAGVIWDAIELDKSIGVARRWAKARKSQDTLLLVTADHDQSMSIIGVQPVADADLTDRSTSQNISVTTPVGIQETKFFKDSNTNVRASYGYYNSGGDPNTKGQEGPPAFTYGNIPVVDGFPDYIDADGDGYPENKQVGSKGSRRLSVGFRTGNHTGSSVPITAEGPGAFLFTGYMDQTDVPFKIMVSLSGDTVQGDNFVSNVLLNPKYPQTFGKQ
jgi:alkaline phosphatase